MKHRVGSLKWFAVAAGMVVAASVLMVWCGQSGGSYVEVGFDDRIELTPQEIRRIEQIGEWEFLSVQSEVVVDTIRKGFFSDDRLTAVYTGVPRIGIDMGDVSDDWVTTHGDTVSLKLPSVRLLDKRFIDDVRTRFFYESGKWSNQAREEMYGKAYREMLRMCMTERNLRKAEKNARAQFTSLFQVLGFHTVEITFGVE